MLSQAIEGFPLTTQQKRVWHFFSTIGKAPFITRAVIHISGHVQLTALEAALQTLIQKNEILRTGYRSSPPMSEPIQVIEPFQFAHKEFNNLEAAGVFDYQIKSTSDLATEVILKLSAIAADTTTLSKIFEQLAFYYKHQLNKQNSELSRFQYADYGQWQLDLKENGDHPTALKYWSRRQGEWQAEPKLSIEEKGKPTHFTPQCMEARVSNGLLEKIQTLENALDLSTGQLLLLVWGAMLQRMLGGEITIAVKIPGRAYEELTHAVGHYDRFLPLSLPLKPGSTVLSSVSQLSESIKELSLYGEHFTEIKPFSYLFENVDLPHPIQVGETTFQLEFQESCNEPFKLKLEILSHGSDKKIRLWHDASRINTRTAELILERYLHFLAQALEHPQEKSFSDFVLPGPIEQRILAEFSSSPAPSKTPNVIQAFQTAASNYPNATAVQCGGVCWTYKELDQRASQLANHLKKLGVAPGTPVGLVAERSVELVAGILGIMKSGAGYVPVDPGYPSDRINFMLEDAGIEILVVQPHLKRKIQSSKPNIIDLDFNGSLAAESVTGGGSIEEDQLAYIIYTSGSTGKPKGVVINHRNLAVSTAARLQYYPETVRNYLLLSSFSFDSSVAGIFWSLTQGGTLTLPAEGTHQDPLEILKLIKKTGVTHLLALPSFYSAILERAESTALSSVQVAIVAGEACPVEIVRLHHTKIAAAKIYNEYGPTEGTVWSTVHQCSKQDTARTVPIGRPVPGMELYILDAQLQPSGIGVAGEIHISGPALSAGYLHREDLTRARFISNPFRPGTKMYKTGDLGSFAMDGTIQFHGRLDHQVKIRGFRIEPGEIEEAILRHHSVLQAVVLAREDSPGEKRLVAYLVLKPGQQLKSAEICDYLQDKLPPFMIPAFYSFMDKFPLMPNGKVDRAGLPAPETIDSARPYVAPSGIEEEFLARIWADLLKLERVGVQENFFELGGHSLLALQMIARVRDSLKVDVPLKAFFESPTVAGMAEAVNRYRSSTSAADLQIKRAHRQVLTHDLLEKLNEKSNETVSDLLLDSLGSKQKGN